MQVGDKVFVYKMGEGWGSGEELAFGPAVIKSIKDYRLFNGSYDIVFEVQMMDGKIIYGYHKKFRDCLYYFITKDEYDDMINHNIRVIDSKIERLFEEKENLFKNVVDWDAVKLI